MSTEKVIVMNESTWNELKNDTAEYKDDATEKVNIKTGYIGMLTGVDVVLDNDLPDSIVEVYDDRLMYEVAKIHGRMSDNE